MNKIHDLAIAFYKREVTPVSLPDELAHWADMVIVLKSQMTNKGIATAWDLQ